MPVSQHNAGDKNKPSASQYSTKVIHHLRIAPLDALWVEINGIASTRSGRSLKEWLSEVKCRRNAEGTFPIAARTTPTTLTVDRGGL